MQSYEPFKMSFFHSRNLTTHNWRPYNKPQLLRICKKLLVFCFVFPPRCTKQDILHTLHWKGESALDGYTDWKGGRRCHFHTLSVRQASAVVGQTIAKRHYWDGNCPFLMENCPPKKSKRIQRGVKVKDQLVSTGLGTEHEYLRRRNASAKNNRNFVQRAVTAVRCWVNRSPFVLVYMLLFFFILYYRYIDNC